MFLPSVIALLFGGLGAWIVLSPQSFGKSFLTATYRAHLVERRFVLFLKTIGISFVLFGLGVFIDELIRRP